MSEIKETMRGMIKYLPFILFVNAGIVYLAWFLDSDETKDAREFMYEGSKALAWIVTAPTCEVNGFCLKILEDRDAGEFVSATLKGDYTQVETTSGMYVVKGNVGLINIDRGALVSLHKKKGELKNVLCISNTNCYLVPFNSRQQ